MVETLRVYCSVLVALCYSLVSLKVVANDTANEHAARASGEEHAAEHRERTTAAAGDRKAPPLLAQLVRPGGGFPPRCALVPSPDARACARPESAAPRGGGQLCARVRSPPPPEVPQTLATLSTLEEGLGGAASAGG